MGKTGKVRHGTQPDGETEGGKEKNERRKGTKERRQKMSREVQKSTEKKDKQGLQKIPRFDGTNPSYCFDWLEQTEALVNEYQGRIYREELLLNYRTNVSKMIHALPQGATNQNIKDAVLRNHSNLRTMSQ